MCQGMSNDCLHMTSKTRVNVLDTTNEGDEWHGYGGELEAGGLAAREKDNFTEIEEEFDLVHAQASPQQYDFAEILIFQVILLPLDGKMALELKNQYFASKASRTRYCIW